MTCWFVSEKAEQTEGLGMKYLIQYSLITQKGMTWILSSESGNWSFYSSSAANSVVS